MHFKMPDGSIMASGNENDIFIKRDIMCQSSVYLEKDGKEQEILKDAVLVEPVDEGVKIQALFESPRVIKARIKKIDLMKHRVILEEMS